MLQFTFFYILLFVLGHIILWENFREMEFLVIGYMHLVFWHCQIALLESLNQFKILPTVFYCLNVCFSIGAVGHVYMCLLLVLSPLVNCSYSSLIFFIGLLLFDHWIMGALSICLEKENCNPYKVIRVTCIQCPGPWVSYFRDSLREHHPSTG